MSTEPYKVYKCDFEECPKSFDTELGLQSHKRVHNTKKKESKERKCTQCNKTFSSGQALGGHLKIHKREVYHPPSK